MSTPSNLASYGSTLSKASSGLGSVFGTTGMSHRFRIDIDYSEFNLGTWARAAGLQVQWQICEYRNGQDWNELRVYPGQPKYQSIKLSRGACHDSQTVQKWLAVTSVKNKPLTGAIALVDWLGYPVVTWELVGFFPQAWSITDFEAGGTKVAMETLELAHSGFLHDQIRLGPGQQR